jgi:hypothetical protein
MLTEDREMSRIHEESNVTTVPILVVRLIAIALLNLVVCSFSFAQQSATERTESRPCIVLSGGGGTITGDKDFDDRWFAVNSAASRSALEQLTAAGYRMVDFIVNPRDAQRRGAGMYREMEKHGCKKVLQIGNELRETPGRTEPSLVFVVSVLHIDTQGREKKSGRGTFTMAADFEKEYSFILTPEAMENLSLSQIGEQIASDVQKSGAL